MDYCQEWGERFLEFLCQRRRVFLVENLFAKGACYRAMEEALPDHKSPLRLMCEGRIKVDITTDVHKGLSQKTLTLAKAGANWYETRAEFEMIPDNESVLRLKIKKIGERNTATVEIPMDEILHLRGNKETRV